MCIFNCSFKVKLIQLQLFLFKSLLVFSDKSNLAVALANHYGTACLSIDGVVTDAIQNGTSAISLLVRQLYDSALAEYEQKKAAEVGKPKISLKQFKNMI